MVRIGSLNVKFFKYQKQSSGDVLLQKQPLEVFLEISQNWQENTCARKSFLIKLHALGLQLINKDYVARVFSYKLWEISKSTFF